LFQDLLRGPSRRNPLNRRLCASPKLPRCVLRESIDLVPNIRSLAYGNAAEVEQTTTFFRSWRIRTACATEGYFQLQRALLERALPELPTRLGGEHRFPSVNAVFASPDARLLKRFLKLLFVFFGSGRPADGHRWRQFFSLCHTHTPIVAPVSVLRVVDVTYQAIVTGSYFTPRVSFFLEVGEI